MNLKRRSVSRFLLPAVLLVAVAAVAWYFLHHRSNATDVSAQYQKYEFRIPMRDGVRLFTAVYVPRDKSQQYPFLITRTPFGVAPYGSSHYPARLGPSDALMRSGYIFVLQDARGRFQSEGQFIDARPHIDDPAPPPSFFVNKGPGRWAMRGIPPPPISLNL